MEQYDDVEDDEEYEDEYDDEEEDDGADTAMVRTLNIHNSNYIWINVDNTDVRVLALIDSGAQVSVLPKRIFDVIPSNVRRKLRTTKIKIKAGNGTEIKCFGVSTIAFSFQELHFIYDLHVVEDAVQPILGYDFLRSTDSAEISPTANTVTINGKVLKLVQAEDI